MPRRSSVTGHCMVPRTTWVWGWRSIWSRQFQDLVVASPRYSPPLARRTLTLNRKAAFLYSRTVRRQFILPQQLTCVKSKSSTILQSTKLFLQSQLFSTKSDKKLKNKKIMFKGRDFICKEEISMTYWFHKYT